jgi:hypothetical protein
MRVNSNAIEKSAKRSMDKRRKEGYFFENVPFFVILKQKKNIDIVESDRVIMKKIRVNSNDIEKSAKRKSHHR